MKNTKELLLSVATPILLWSTIEDMGTIRTLSTVVVIATILVDNLKLRQEIQIQAMKSHPAWCSTCGIEVKDVQCVKCDKWWKENEPI